MSILTIISPNKFVHWHKHILINMIGHYCSLSVVLVLTVQVCMVLCDQSIGNNTEESDHILTSNITLGDEHQQSNVKDWPITQGKPEELYEVESETIENVSQQQHVDSSHSNSILLDDDIIHNDDTIKYWCTIQSKDALSAIKRAKTISCKQQLIDTVCQLQTLDHKYSHNNLKNYCVRDKLPIHKKYEHIGCHISPVDETAEKFVFIDSHSTEIQCVDTCYKYGYELAALENKTECYCSAQSMMDLIEHRSIDLYRNQTVCQIDSCTEENCSLDKAFDVYFTDSYINPEFKPANQSKDPGSLRIVFILTLNGRAVRQVRRLIKNLFSSRHTFYIHVDSRDDYLYRELLPLEKKFSNIFLVKNRYGTIWGGSSLLRMLLDSIRQLLESTTNWDYIINLSESDYTIKPLADLESYLSENYGAIFLKSHSLDNLKFIKKQGLDKTFYECEDRMWRLGDRDLPYGIIYTGGSDWFALPRDFCSFINQDESLLKPLIRLFNQTLLPAESFFHTAALNSEFCHSVIGNNLRISNWKRKQGCKCQHRDVVDWCGCSPLVYRQKDWPKLKSTLNHDIFFSRKFDPTISQEIIYRVDEDLLHKGKEIHQEITDSGDSGTYSSWRNYWENLMDEHDLKHNDDRRTQLFKNFAYLSMVASNMMAQNTSEMSKFVDHVQLKSIDLLFGRIFEGHIITFCFEESVYMDRTGCIQLFVQQERHPDNKTSRHDVNDCFEEASLKWMEMGSDFDIKERMFRTRGGVLGAHSDIVLYHSWYIFGPANENKNYNNTKVRFRLSNRHSRRGGHILDVKLKPKAKSSALLNTFAQALHIRLKKPITTGEWTLSLENEASGDHCVDYNFLVIPDVKEKEDLFKIIYDFATNYRIVDSCYIQPEGEEIEESTLLDFIVGEHWVQSYCQATYWSTKYPDNKSYL